MSVLHLSTKFNFSFRQNFELMRDVFNRNFRHDVQDLERCTQENI